MTGDSLRERQTCRQSLHEVFIERRKRGGKRKRWGERESDRETVSDCLLREKVERRQWE